MTKAVKAAAEMSVDSAFIKHGELGSYALWCSFIFLAASTVYFMFAMFSVPDGQRKFHIYTMAITGIASIAYLTMASGGGYIGGEGNTRQFFYARYLDWAATTPLLLLDVAALGGASTDTLLFLLITDAMMIVAGLVGALFETQVKWFFWMIGNFFFAPIVYYLVSGLTATSQKLGTSGAVMPVAILTAVSWTAYPVVWALCEGTGVLNCDTEAMLYCGLDITAKAVFGFMVISSRDAIAAATGKY
jgi:bacteriorhodopsin